MSLDASKWAWTQVADLGAAEALVLLRVADHASKQEDDRFSCWPGIDQLAEATGRGEKTIRRALTSLEAAGLISRERRADGEGRGRKVDLIVLHIDELSNRSKRPVGEPDQEVNLTGKSECSTGHLIPTNRSSDPDQPVISDPPIDRRTVKNQKEPLQQLAPARERFFVDDIEVPEADEDLARRLLQAFNVEANAMWPPALYVGDVIRCMRLFPDLSEADHFRVIRAAFASQWWKRDDRGAQPSPAVIWKEDGKQFARTLHESRRQDLAADPDHESYDDPEKDLVIHV